MRHFHRLPWALIGLSLLAILLRWPSLEQPFDNDSAANAYHARLILRGEPLYSTHHPAHHLPAIYYIYAFSFGLLGDNLGSVKLILILWTIVTLWVVYACSKLWLNPALAQLATLFYLILTSDIYLFGLSAQIELFANLPRILIVGGLIYLLTRPAPAWSFMFIGLSVACAFWFKAVYLSPLLLVFIAIWLNYKKSALIYRLVAVAAGFLLGLMPWLAYFAWANLLPRFFLVFTLGQNYVGGHVITVPSLQWLWLLYPPVGLLVNNPALFIFSVSAVIVIIRQHLKLAQSPPWLLYLVGWYFLSYLEAVIGRAYYLHYYLLLVPPLVILAAWFLGHTRSLLQSIRHPRLAQGVFYSFITLALLISMAHNFNYYYHYGRYKLGYETFQTFIRDGWQQTDLLELAELARYIQAHTQPNDYIYYWSENIQLYYLADRRAPVDIIWVVYVSATGPAERIFNPNTKYIIIDPARNKQYPAWFSTGLAQHYRLETILGQQKIYKRLE